MIRNKASVYTQQKNSSISDKETCNKVWLSEYTGTMLWEMDHSDPRHRRADHVEHVLNANVLQAQRARRACSVR